MKTRPILFNGDMVRAILAGKKTQTRRAVKDAPHHQAEYAGHYLHEKWDWLRHDGLRLKTFKCPYGEPGDRLWVRETFRPIYYQGGNSGDVVDYSYRATPQRISDLDAKWKPSIFMPRDASRIDLRINTISVERLQDIGNFDAAAEGVADKHGDFFGPFKELWESINGKGSFDDRWVWVIEFERV